MNPRRILETVLSIAVLGLVVLLPGITPALATDSPYAGDFGDAPDNQSAGYGPPFTAVVGHFPTYYATTNSRFGLAGGNTVTIGLESLGPLASPEFGANDAFDPDTVENLIDDDFDDGLFGDLCPSGTPSVPWPSPLSVGLTFRVTVAPGAPSTIRYLNVLIDKNHDGVWSAPGEWVTVDKFVAIAPGTTGFVTVGPFPFPLSGVGSWMRVALTRSPVVGSFTDNGTGWDGSGSFSFGEVEDYLIARDNLLSHAAAAAAASANATAFSLAIVAQYDDAYAFESALAAVYLDLDVSLALTASATASAEASAAASAYATAQGYANAVAAECANAQASASALAVACASCPCATVCALAQASATAAVSACAQAQASATTSASAAASASASASARATAAATAYSRANAKAFAFGAAYGEAQAHAVAIGVARGTASAHASAAASASAAALAAACSGDVTAATAASAGAAASASAAASSYAAAFAEAQADAYAWAVAGAAAEACVSARAEAQAAAAAAGSASSYASSAASAASSAYSTSSKIAIALTSAHAQASASCSSQCCPKPCNKCITPGLRSMLGEQAPVSRVAGLEDAACGLFGDSGERSCSSPPGAQPGAPLAELLAALESLRRDGIGVGGVTPEPVPVQPALPL